MNPQSWNRYTYVFNNPLRYVDPTGNYGEDVHRDLIFALALAVGFDTKAAGRISAEDQLVDEDARGPHDPASILNGSLENFHFTSAERPTALWDSFQKSGSEGDLGTYLHTLQDSYSHRGFDTYPYKSQQQGQAGTWLGSGQDFRQSGQSAGYGE